jgi:hypothetical protein
VKAAKWRGTKARPFAVMVASAIGALAWAGPAAAAGPIAGTVTDQSAQPLPGIEVCAVVLAPYRETCAFTDASGKYSIPDTGPGYEVRFSDPDGVAPSRAPQWYPGKRYPEEGEAVTQAEIDDGVDATMGPGAEVLGRVLARGSEAPLADIEVCAKPTVFRAGESALCARSKSDGTFVLSDIGPGSYEVHFMPGEGVNYLTASFPQTFAAGDVKGMEALLKRGAEFEGHLTDGSTGLPVEPFGGPGTTPAICALSDGNEERVKCVPVGAGGEYALAGLPTGAYVLVFAEDLKEDGVVMSSDGYVRQYYDDKPNFEEALVLLIEAGAVETGLDATLVRGAEIWPEEEEEEAAPWEPIDEEFDSGPSSGGGTNGESQQGPPGAGAPSAGRPGPLSVTPPPRRTVLPKVSCEKGFHRVAKGGSSRCVKIKAKPKRHRPKKHHAKKAAHR